MPWPSPVAAVERVGNQHRVVDRRDRRRRDGRRRAMPNLTFWPILSTPGVSEQRLQERDRVLFADLVRDSRPPPLEEIRPRRRGGRSERSRPRPARRRAKRRRAPPAAGRARSSRHRRRPARSRARGRSSLKLVEARHGLVGGPVDGRLGFGRPAPAARSAGVVGAGRGGRRRQARRGAEPGRRLRLARRAPPRRCGRASRPGRRSAGRARSPRRRRRRSRRRAG